MATSSSLSFCKQFYGRPSTYLWEDEEGVVREIQQGEGGEQGDPLMPALFALGQHQALVAVQETLQPSERLLAFLDDVYVASVPARIDTVEESLEDKLWRHARISINQGKTQVWTPPDCEHLFFDANGEPSGVWRGDHSLPTHEQGITILATPLGHVDFVQGQLDEKIDEHGVLLDRISKVPDLQCAWLLLLLCAASRANYVLRVVNPALSFRVAQMHDAGIR